MHLTPTFSSIPLTQYGALVARQIGDTVADREVVRVGLDVHVRELGENSEKSVL
jgi:hypothetical protein